MRPSCASARCRVEPAALASAGEKTFHLFPPARLEAGRDIDTMHDGMGFLTQHVAVTNELALALQAVDPSLALPFWDYTEDIARVRAMKGDTSDLWASELWSDDWYGNATGSDRHTVKKGRFAYQRVTRDRNATTHKSSVERQQGPVPDAEPPVLRRDLLPGHVAVVRVALQHDVQLR